MINRKSGRELAPTGSAHAAAAQWIATRLRGITCAPLTIAANVVGIRSAEAAPTLRGLRRWTSDGRSSPRWPIKRLRRGACGERWQESSAHGMSSAASAWVNWARSTTSRSNRSRSTQRGQRAGPCVANASSPARRAGMAVDHGVISALAATRGGRGHLIGPMSRGGSPRSSSRLRVARVTEVEKGAAKNKRPPEFASVTWTQAG